MSRQKAPQQSETALCDIYISPDERRLLARIALRRGVGRDYLALRGSYALPDAPRRPVPQWLGRSTPAAKAEEPARPRMARQAQHCRSCVRLSVAPITGQDAGQDERYVCTAGMWTRPLLKQSLRNSRRVRALSLTCPLYAPAGRPQRIARRHCRACQQLVAADTVDVRFVCARALWTNPMKPQSVANSRRLRSLSETCPHYVPRPGGGLACGRRKPAPGA